MGFVIKKPKGLFGQDQNEKSEDTIVPDIFSLSKEIRTKESSSAANDGKNTQDTSEKDEE